MTSNKWPEWRSSALYLIGPTQRTDGGYSTIIRLPRSRDDRYTERKWGYWKESQTLGAWTQAKIRKTYLIKTNRLPQNVTKEELSKAVRFWSCTPDNIHIIRVREDKRDYRYTTFKPIEVDPNRVKVAQYKRFILLWGKKYDYQIIRSVSVNKKGNQDFLRCRREGRFTPVTKEQQTNLYYHNQKRESCPAFNTNK